MHEHFYQSSQLSPEALGALTKKRDQPAILHFAIMYSGFLIAAVWVVIAWGGGVWWQVLLSQLFFGMWCCSIFASEHETVHNTAFRSLPLNRLAATMAGLAHIYPSTLFRELHFTHHRHTHEPGLDPEISLGGKPGPSVLGSKFMYFTWLTGFPLLSFKLLMTTMGALGMPEFARKGLFPFVHPSARKAIWVESMAVFGLHLGITLLAIFWHSSFWGLWLGQAVGHALLSSYLVMEHNGLPHEGTIMDKTRSIPTNAFIKWLMWNMPYHAEHHAYPAVPYHALPQLHQALKPEIKHGEEGHAAFHWKVLTK